MDLPGDVGSSKCVMIENYFTVDEQLDLFEALKTGIAWEQKQVLAQGRRQLRLALF